MFSIQKPRKDLALPSSYRPMSTRHDWQIVRENPALRILCEVSGRGLLRDEQFGFRPKHSTALQLARLVERVSRNSDERRLTGVVFLDVAKAFDTVWVNGLLYKLTVLNFPSYLVKAISSYLTRSTGWSSSGWDYFTRPLRPVCKGNAFAFPPLWASSLCTRHGSHSHVPSASAAHQIPGGLSQ